MNPALFMILLPGFPPPMTSPSSLTRIKSETVQREKARARGLTQKVPLFAGSLAKRIGKKKKRVSFLNVMTVFIGKRLRAEAQSFRGIGDDLPNSQVTSLNITQKGKEG